MEKLYLLFFELEMLIIVITLCVMGFRFSKILNEILDELKKITKK